MKRYIAPEVVVIELDLRESLMVSSPVGFGDGETISMEAATVRQRSSDWSDYESF